MFGNKRMDVKKKKKLAWPLSFCLSVLYCYESGFILSLSIEHQDEVNHQLTTAQGPLKILPFSISGRQTIT